METLTTRLVGYLWTQSWQIAALALMIAVASFALRNKSAHVRYLLWLIVLAKCLTPPVLTVPLAVLPEERPAGPPLVLPIQMPTITVETAGTRSLYDLPAPAPHRPAVTERLAQITIAEWLAVAWIAGASIFLILASTKALRTSRWLHRHRKQPPPKFSGDVESLYGALGIKMVPTVWLIDGIGQPFVWGLPRGSIYLPADFARLSNPRHRPSVLMHELSHVLRFDAFVNLLQIIAQAVFWFHPLVWWVNRKLRQEREKSCDEMAIARLDALPADYGSAIVNTLVAEHKCTRPFSSLAVAGPVRNIEDRIKTIMNPGRRFYRRPRIIAVVSVLLFAAVAVPTTLALTSRQSEAASETRPIASEHSTGSPDANVASVAYYHTWPEPSSSKQREKPQILFDCRIYEVPPDLEIARSEQRAEDDTPLSVYIGSQYADRLEELVRTEPNASKIATPRLLVSDGKEGKIRVGARAVCITGYLEPDRPGQDPTPITEDLFLGIELRIVGKVLSNGAVKLNLNFTQWKPGFNNRADGKGREIQIPLVTSNTLTSAVVTEGGEPVLIGGLQSADSTDKELVLLLTPSIVTGQKRDQPADRTPADHTGMNRLAAEYAFRGDFDKAVEFQEKAIQLAEAEERYGIGVAIRQTDGLMIIEQILPDAPAFASGLKAGDVIEEVNGFGVGGMSLHEIARRIVGPKGTAVTLSVRHAGRDTSENVTITREKKTRLVPPEYRLRLDDYQARRDYQKRFTPAQTPHRVFQLRNLKAVDLLVPLNELFPDQAEGRPVEGIFAQPEKNQIMVFGSLDGMDRVGAILAKLDVPPGTRGQPDASEPDVVEVFKLKYADCEQVAGILVRLISARHKLDPQETTQLTIVPDRRTNCLIIQGTGEDMRQLKALIEALDVRDPASAYGVADPKESRPKADISGDEPRTKTTQNLKALESERGQIARKMDALRSEIRQLSREYDAAGLAGRQDMRLQRVSRLLDELTKTEARRINLETQLKLLQKTRGSVAPEQWLKIRQEYMNADPTIKALSQTIAELEAELLALAQTLSEDHPEPKRRAELIERLRARLNEYRDEVGKTFDDLMSKPESEAQKQKMKNTQAELEQTRLYEQCLKDLLQRQDEAAIVSGRTQLAIEKLKQQLDVAMQVHDELCRRIDDLKKAASMRPDPSGEF